MESYDYVNSSLFRTRTARIFHLGLPNPAGENQSLTPKIAGYARSHDPQLQEMTRTAITHSMHVFFRNSLMGRKNNRKMNRAELLAILLLLRENADQLRRGDLFRRNNRSSFALAVALVVLLSRFPHALTYDHFHFSLSRVSTLFFSHFVVG